MRTLIKKLGLVAALLIATVSGALAQSPPLIPVPQLPPGQTATGSELFPVWQNSALRQLTVAQLQAVFGGGGSGSVSSVGLSLPGSVFAVTGSPVTGSGTLAGSFINQTQNQVFASPNGAGGTPTFRALVSADLPSVVTAGSCTSCSITYNAEGQITAASSGGGAGSGTVTSVGLSLPNIFSVSGSPVTAAGTLTATLVSQTAHFVFAAPSSGSGTPTFRTLVSGDLPSVVTAGSCSVCTITYNAEGQITAASTGSGAGSVTSVAMTVPSFLTVTGSPITTSGTLALGLASQSANQFLASPNGSSGIPSFRAIVAADLPAAVGLTTAANSWSATQSSSVVTLTSGTTVTPAFGTSSGNVFKLVLAGNVTTLSNPTGTIAGVCGIIEIDQPASGGPFVISNWGNDWTFPGGTLPTLSTAANAADVVSFCGTTSTTIRAAFQAAFAT